MNQQVKGDYIKSTCDNCLATQRDGGDMDSFCYSTVDSSGNMSMQQIVACDGCNFLFYCNEVSLS